MPSRWPLRVSALIGSYATLSLIDSVATGSISTTKRWSPYVGHDQPSHRLVTGHVPHAVAHRPQSDVHRRGAGTGWSLAALADLDPQRAYRRPGRVGGGPRHRGRGGAVRVVRV